LGKRKGEVWERGRERFWKEEAEFQFKIVVHVEVAHDPQ
jgi:hypothetical protein